MEQDFRLFKEHAAAFRGVELVAGGLPCPPFSVAGKQLGADDERNLFPDALDVIDAVRPKAVMIENVRDFLDAVFRDYREGLKTQLRKMGYVADWRLLNASHFGVPQLRPPGHHRGREVRPFRRRPVARRTAPQPANGRRGPARHDGGGWLAGRSGVAGPGR